MYPVLVCFLIWISAVIFETTIFSVVDWFQPNLYFAAVMAFCLRWKGSEVYFIALLFGLTADCFSTLPFGIYGLSFFLVSFLIRIYAIKIFEESLFITFISTGGFLIIMTLVVVMMLKTFFVIGDFSGWFNVVLFHEIIPTMIISMVFYRILVHLDAYFKIHLADRKF